MRKITDISPLNEIVYSILRTYPEARTDDNLLIEKIYEIKLGKSGRNLHHKEFLKRIKEGKLPKTETVTRYKRIWKLTNNKF